MSYYDDKVSGVFLSVCVARLFIFN